MQEKQPPLSLGTLTKWGKIGAIGITEGERYYWIVDKYRTVSMMPADVVEAEIVSSS